MQKEMLKSVDTRYKQTRQYCTTGFNLQKLLLRPFRALCQELFYARGLHPRLIYYALSELSVFFNSINNPGIAPSGSSRANGDDGAMCGVLPP